MISYEKLMKETHTTPNLVDLAEAVGFVSRRLGRPDYCPPVMEILLEQASASNTVN